MRFVFIVFFFIAIYGCGTNKSLNSKSIEVQISSPFGSLQTIKFFNNDSCSLVIGRSHSGEAFDFIEVYQNCSLSISNSSYRFTIDSMINVFNQSDLTTNAPLDDNFHVRVFVNDKLKVDTYGYSLGLFRLFKVTQLSVSNIDRRSDFFTLISRINYQ